MDVLQLDLLVPGDDWELIVLDVDGDVGALVEGGDLEFGLGVEHDVLHVVLGLVDAQGEPFDGVDLDGVFLEEDDAEGEFVEAGEGWVGGFDGQAAREDLVEVEFLGLGGLLEGEAVDDELPGVDLEDAEVDDVFDEDDVPGLVEGADAGGVSDWVI